MGNTISGPAPGYATRSFTRLGDFMNPRYAPGLEPDVRGKASRQEQRYATMAPGDVGDLRAHNVEVTGSAVALN